MVKRTNKAQPSTCADHKQDINSSLNTKDATYHYYY